MGALEGESVDFNRHGEVVQRSNYRSNLLEGYLTRYWPGGKVMERTLYAQGSPETPTDRFNQEGSRVDRNFEKPTFLERLKHILRGD
jgi:antitoxin component YwqK of YwqJK toxin-antitoxin module